MWSGKQIVSPSWIEDSTSVHSRCKELKMSYGYLWWIFDEDDAYAAMRDSGNVIYVNKKKELVIAMSALFKEGAKDRRKLIKEYIEPVFESE